MGITENMRLKDQVAVITGGASGIGRATAETFLEEGARVAVVDCQQPGLDELRLWNAARCDKLRTYNADVTDNDSTDRIVKDLCAAWRRIDILVTAAAISVGKRVGETRDEEWRRVLHVNIDGTFGWVRAVIPIMVEQQSGSIVTLGSQLSTAGGRANAAYVTSKGAVLSLTRSVALDYAQAGIRCNCIAPGGTDTPLLESAFSRSSLPEQARKELTARHAMNRLAAPREIASSILYLASSQASFVTGSQLIVDGGWLAA